MEDRLSEEHCQLSSSSTADSVVGPQNTRGPTTYSSFIVKNKELDEKEKIKWNQVNQIESKNGSKYSECIGVLLTTSRRYDWTLHWDEQHKEDKEWLWGELKDLFELDENYKKPTLQTICSGVFRNRKAKWKAAGFTPYEKHEDRIRHKPYMLNEREWEDLVKFWSTDEGHQTKKKSGVPPTEGDVFIEYHTSKKSKKAMDPVSEGFIVQMRERAGLEENGFDENGEKQSIHDDVYKEVVPAATRNRKRARAVENDTTSCASSGYSSRIGELEKQVIDLKEIISEKDKETERIVRNMALENDRRFKEFEKRMMDNMASLMFRPEQFFRPQEQTFMPQLPIYRGAMSDPLYMGAMPDQLYRAATSSYFFSRRTWLQL